jgi:protein-S-isoprenylcysteine O-methyltransferase Ste14
MSEQPVIEQPPLEQTAQQLKPRPARRILQVVITYIWFTCALFLAAGRLDWTRGWISVVLSVTGMTAMGIIIQRYNPELMVQRARWRHKDTKPFDKVFMALYMPLVLLHPAVAGLDAVRFRWSAMPFAMVYVGAVLFIASLVLLTWVMVVNPYAESSVRIQTDRGQTVVTSGPYRFVRHPMYVGVIVMGLANPLIWGSVWALVMSAVIILLFIWRTAREDATLRHELPGYEDFAARTPPAPARSLVKLTT